MYIDRANLAAASQLSGDQVIALPNSVSNEDDVAMADVIPLIELEGPSRFTSAGKLDMRMRGNRDNEKYFNFTYHKIKEGAGASQVRNRQVVQPAVNLQTFKLVVCTICQTVLHTMFIFIECYTVHGLPKATQKQERPKQALSGSAFGPHWQYNGRITEK